MIKSVIRGHYIYKNVWNLSVCEELTCKQEKQQKRYACYGSVGKEHNCRPSWNISPKMKHLLEASLEKNTYNITLATCEN